MPPQPSGSPSREATKNKPFGGARSSGDGAVLVLVAIDRAQLVEQRGDEREPGLDIDASLDDLDHADMVPGNLRRMTDHPLRERIEDLERRKDQAYQAGSDRAVERQHAKGKMLARERIDYLLDPGSFHELDMLARHRAHAAGLEEQPVHRRRRSPAGARSTAARSSSSARTSPCSAARSARCSPRRSTR